jgi:hypothetical protein
MLIEDVKKAVKAFLSIYDFASIALLTKEGWWDNNSTILLDKCVVKGIFTNRHTGEMETYGFSSDVIIGIIVTNEEEGTEAHYGAINPCIRGND